MEAIEISARDSTRIRYFRAGPRSDHPILVMPPIGMSVQFFAGLIEHFAPRRTLLAWDKRGLRDSEVLSDRSRLGAGFDVEDAREIFEREGVRHADFVCWCNSSKLFAKIDAAEPGLASHVAFINCVFEKEQPAWRNRFEALLNGVRDASDPLVEAVADLIRGWAEQPSPELMQKVLQVDPEASFLNLFDVVTTNGGVESARLAFEKLDSPQAIRNYLFLESHYSDVSVVDHIRTCSVPLLFLYGERDSMVDPKHTREMQALVPGATVVEVPGGTHYCFLEHPDVVMLPIERFFDGSPLRRVGGTEIGTASAAK